MYEACFHCYRFGRCGSNSGSANHYLNQGYCIKVYGSTEKLWMKGRLMQ